MIARLAFLLVLSIALQAQPPVPSPDPALEMVEGIKRWLIKETERKQQSPLDVEHLRFLIGAVDPLAAPSLETTAPPLAEHAGFTVFAARWAVFDGYIATGLYFKPRSPAKCRAVVAPETNNDALKMAASGCEVLAVSIIDRDKTYANSEILNRHTGLTHRELVYRMAFPLGRHPLGYDTQAVLAAARWLESQQPKLPLWASGEGDGALAVLYAAALDRAVAKTWLADQPRDPRKLHTEPLDRNVFGWLPDAQVASLVAPRELHWGSHFAGPAIALDLKPPDRRREQMRGIANHIGRHVVLAEASRAARFTKEGSAALKQTLWNEVLGRFPTANGPLNAKVTKAYSGEGYEGFDVRFDVLEDVFGYGVLLRPLNLKPGEKRPVVVLQHGLHGRPQWLFQQPAGRPLDVYSNYGETLVRSGFIVYIPQNPYIHDFRPIARLGNPLGYSIYSFILAQYERMIAWLVTLPEADPERIGFYGLSYGGKTALRVPPLLPQFKAAVCAGDFNEWIRKLVTLDYNFSYVFTVEYELLEWNLAWVASHAEMAQMMAPRPFMVERGHRDMVGVDEWVEYEFAKVRRYYDEAGLGDRTGIAFFNGPHKIDGAVALEFLKRWLGK